MPLRGRRRNLAQGAGSAKTGTDTSTSPSTKRSKLSMIDVFTATPVTYPFLPLTQPLYLPLMVTPPPVPDFFHPFSHPTENQLYLLALNHHLPSRSPHFETNPQSKPPYSPILLHYL